MTRDPYSVPDADLERLLAERAPHGPTAERIDGILTTVTTASQVRRGPVWGLGLGLPRTTRLVLVAAGLIAIVVMAGLLVGGPRRPDLGLVSPAPSGPAVVASPSPAVSPSRAPTPSPAVTPNPSASPVSSASPVPSASPSPSATPMAAARCAAGEVDVLAPADIGVGSSDPGFVGVSRVSGVYVVDGPESWVVWATSGPGTTRSIAAIRGRRSVEVQDVVVQDVTRDGRSAIVSVDAASRAGVGCSAAFLIDTDGVRVVSIPGLASEDTAAHRDAVSIDRLVFSPDGRMVALERVTRWVDNRVDVSVGVVDIGQRRELWRVTTCSGLEPKGIPVWAPSGRLLAVGCDDRYTIHSVESAGGVTATILDLTEESSPDALWWDDDEHVVTVGSVAAAGPFTLIQTTLEGGRQRVVGSFDTQAGECCLIVVAPDHRHALLARRSFIERPGVSIQPMHVVDLDGGTPWQVGSGFTGDPAWSDDGGAVIYVQQDATRSLVAVDVATTDARILATLPSGYHQGIWRSH